MSTRASGSVPGTRRREPEARAAAWPRRAGHVLGTLIIVATLLTGRHIVDAALVQPARNAGYSDGICAALEMAAAHGALDDIAYQKVLKAMTTMLAPEYDRYEISHRHLLLTCLRARTGSDARLTELQ